METRRVGMYRESPGSDIVKQGYLKKLKTMKKKYFVLRSTSSSGPARLDYFDSEKKFKASHPPKKSYQLWTCFNINKRTDTKHKFVIVIFLPSEVFTIIAENEDEQKMWLDKLLEFQNEYLPQDTEPRVHYDYVWQGVVKHKSPSSCTKISGAYRFCLSEKSVCLVKVNEYKPSFQFQLSSIRKCGASEHFFMMEVGRSAVTGSGEIWLEVESSSAAQNMHDVFTEEMAASRAVDDPFRRRSNTGSGVPYRSGDGHPRKRATSESTHHHPHGSPRRQRASYMTQRPQSTVVYSQKSNLGVDSHIPPSSSPGMMNSFLERERSYSTGSRTSHTSRHSDMLDHHQPYEMGPVTPVISPEGSFISTRSTTPDASCIAEEDGELSDSYITERNNDYLPMDPVHRSLTPSPTRGQGQGHSHYDKDDFSDNKEKFSVPPAKVDKLDDYLSMIPGKSEGEDYLPMTPGEKAEEQDAYLSMTPGEKPDGQSAYLDMTPGHRSGTPSPTRSDRPGSAGSHSRESSRDGYMEMRPGSAASSPASSHDNSYMNMTPPKSGNGAYMDMNPMTPPPQQVNNGYIDMNPGQRTPTDPGPGYVLMEGTWVRTSAMPIPARSKELYLDMGTHGPSNQPLPTVKESGSGEAYLPMSPSGQSISSEGLKPAKVYSYLSDDSMSGEFPKRAYSVGSRPISKPFRYHHQQQELLRKQPLDSSMSSSAPHLISQKSRSQYIEPVHHKGGYYEGSHANSPLSTSMRSDDSESFVEMDFCRPRTSSDSFGIRPRSSSFGTQVFKGHRPRSSSYGQGAKPISKLAAGLRTDSYESVRTTSQEISSRQRSQESLGLMSSSSRNSSSESLKKLSSDSSKKSLGPGEYMDMSYEKNRPSSSQSIHGVVSPKRDPTGYMDMSLGGSAPKSHTISPCSSSHSLSALSSNTLGSSPGALSSAHGHQVDKSQQGAKVIKPSGKLASQKQSYKSPPTVDTQLKVTSVRVKRVDKRSPSGSGKESEDESYIPFQPTVSSPSVSQEEMMAKLHGQTSFEHLPRSHPGIKIQHGYSRSYDSGVRSPDPAVSRIELHPDPLTVKSKPEDKHKAKVEETSHHKSKSKSDKDKKSSEKDKKGSHKKGQKSPKFERGKEKGRKDSETSLHERLAEIESPTEERLEFIPDDDLFSNKVFSDKDKISPDETVNKKEESAYLDYNPGFEASLPKNKHQNEIPEVVKSPIQMKEFVPKRYVEREYCEIEFPSELREKLKVSDYVESDPAPLKELDKTTDADCGTVKITDAEETKEAKESKEEKEEEKEPTQKAEKSPRRKLLPTDDFSYMDFDPAMEKKEEVDVEKRDEVKAPHRVRSFIADSSLLEETEADHLEKNEEIKGCSKESKASVRRESSSSSNKTEGKASVDSRSSARIKSRENSGDKIEGGAKYQNNDSIKKGICESCQVVMETGTCQGHGKTVADENKENEKKEKKLMDADSKVGSGCKVHADRHVGKLVIKQVHPTSPEGQPVQDEGYCDLDFSDSVQGQGKDHKRTGSTSSSNSDRSRKVFDSVGSEDSIPCPETPISYISEESDDLPVPETPLSYISDDSSSSLHSIKDSGSPYKSPVAARSSNPISKVSGFGLSSFGVGAEALRKSLPTSRAQGAAQNLVSRQTSAPVGPAASPRNSAEIQQQQLPYRTRKASGPAVLSSQQRNSGPPATSTAARTSQSSLEPVIAGQELHKQKSMPCMNLPQNTGRMSDLESIDHVHSRHSFTDLSQYEEMNFPASSLSSGNQQKYSSQQQLNSEASSTSNELHYADLDLNGSSENMDGASPRVVKSRAPTSLDDVSKVQYAEIDHLKTEKMKTEKEVKFYVN